MYETVLMGKIICSYQLKGDTGDWDVKELI